jgi:hypothetical protein
MSVQIKKMNKFGITVFAVMTVRKIQSLAIVIIVKLAKISTCAQNVTEKEIIIMNF